MNASVCVWERKGVRVVGCRVVPVKLGHFRAQEMAKFGDLLEYLDKKNRGSDRCMYLCRNEFFPIELIM